MPTDDISSLIRGCRSVSGGDWFAVPNPQRYSLLSNNGHQRDCKRQTVTIEETYDISELPVGTTFGGDKFTVIRSYIRVKVIREEDPCSDGGSVSDTAGCVETATVRC